jgi:hypothetical protein
MLLRNSPRGIHGESVLRRFLDTQLCHQNDLCLNSVACSRLLYKLDALVAQGVKILEIGPEKRKREHSKSVSVCSLWGFGRGLNSRCLDL